MSTTIVPPAHRPSGSTASASSAGGAGTASANAGGNGVPPAAPNMPPAAGDHFDTVPGTPTAAAPQSAPLPDVLASVGRTRVVHGDDAGDFYCEHMFYGAQKAAVSLASVQTNAHGEKLVGFLHVPWDAETSRTPPAGGVIYSQAARHHNTREVIGFTLRGYFDTAAPNVTGDVKLMVTGYGPFSSARDNPTGDFVRHTENLDAAMAKAFGPGLMTKTGTPEPGFTDADATRLRYQVKDASGRPRDVVIEARWFPVTDDAIDGQHNRSVQRSMERFGAHGVVSMGVHSGREYLAEHNADDGGLDAQGDTLSHNARLNARDKLPKNFALARAVHAGAQSVRSISPMGTRLPPNG